MDIAALTRRILDRRERSDDPLRIVQAGHPALRRRSRRVTGRLDDALVRELAAAMVPTMRDAPGVGLAAPQVGVPTRLVVVEDRHAAPPGEDPDDDLLERRALPLRILVDPVVEALDGDRVFAWEGCLSVAGWRSIVPRSRGVRLRALELGADGATREVDEEVRGWSARILQHEVDHLDGVLCHDRMVPRSYVADAHVHRYAELPEAVRRLGLTGGVALLGPGEVVLPAGADGTGADAGGAPEGGVA